MLVSCFDSWRRHLKLALCVRFAKCHKAASCIDRPLQAKSHLWSLEVRHVCQHSLVPVAVAVATGCAMSGGGFNFISSPRLLVFRLLVLRRSFNLICSLLGGTTVQTVGEDKALRCAVELVCTTLVTVMVCLEVVPADGLVTTIVPSDGNWFSWFKTKVVVEGWGFSCKDNTGYTFNA